MPDPITRSAIEATARKIAPYVRRTPVMEVTLSKVAQPIVLKLELFQHTGSFKARGAFSTVLGRDIPEAGIAAASGGNHGAAAAYAAYIAGVPAHIFVPAIASPAKVAKIRSYGAVIDQDGATYYDALEDATASSPGRALCRCMPMTRCRRYWARALWVARSRSSCPISIRCWWRWVAAA